MTNPPAPPTLEYAMLRSDPRERRRRVVWWTAAAGAAALSIMSCAGLAFAIYHSAAGLPRVDDPAMLLLQWIYYAWGLVLLAAAVLAWRAARPDSSASERWAKRLFLTTFIVGTIVTLLSLVLSLEWMEPTDVIDLASDQSKCFVLLMPLLLSSPRISPRRWLGRAIVLAAATLLLAGVAGVAHLVVDARLIEERQGLRLADAIRVAIQRPAPIVGLWPFSGIAGGVVLLASLPTQNRVAIRIAVASGLAFIVLMAWMGFWWFNDPVSRMTTLWIQATMLIETFNRVVGVALPLVLLWWATSSKQLAEERPEDEASMSVEASKAVID